MIVDENNDDEQNKKDDKKDEEDEEKKLMPPPAQSEVKKAATTPKKKEEKKPLASMLPDKYKETDVREIFPEFRQSSVLRFSRLFPIKPQNRPRIWKGIKKLKRRSSQDEDANSNSAKKFKENSYGENLKLEFAPPPEDPDAYQECDDVQFSKWKEVEQKKVVVEDGDDDDDEETPEKKKKRRKKGPKSTDWRWGPAQYWYDMLNLPDVVENYDYGLKKAAEDSIKTADVEKKQNTSTTTTAATNSTANESSKPAIAKPEFPPDAFLMVTQVNWEDDVIWNGDDIRHKVLQKVGKSNSAAGWVPTSFNRNFSTNAAQTPQEKQKIKQKQKLANKDEDEQFYSIFPVENEELAYGRWEDEVIWDTDNMPKSLKPKMVSIDPNDDNIILGIPEDIDPSTLPSDQPVRKVKIIQKHVKKSRMLLNRSGIISVVEEESPPPPPKLDDLDPFNVSNDEFYLPKTRETITKSASATGASLQHATPVVELKEPFVPTYMGPVKLRQFHRWPLKRSSHGALANYLIPHGVQPLLKH